jgi:twitching motility two-component system response regulator PilH
LARKILLADDSVTAQNMGRKILTDAGYEVITVNNGSSALKKITETKPDLVVLDVYMPGYSGLEVCQRVKESRDLSQIPVLLTVGKLEPFKQDEARRARADAFIVKPFEATELLAAVAKLQDKLAAVPAPASTKDGRIAAATMASFERVMSESAPKFGDQDSGWKARLTIPAGGAKPPDGEPEASIPTSTGFRDVVDKPVSSTASKDPNSFSERPIPTGIPQDITADEIAAITAAAARVNVGMSVGKDLERLRQDSSRFKPSTPVEKAEADRKQDNPAVDVLTEPSANLAEKNGDSVAKKIAPAIPADTPVSEPALELPSAVTASVSDTAVGVNVAAKAAEASRPTTAKTSSAVASGVTAEPATLAVATRWVAEEIAVGADEAVLVLEREMHKAFAAFAAAEYAALPPDQRGAIDKDDEPIFATMAPPAIGTPVPVDGEAENSDKHDKVADTPAAVSEPVAPQLVTKPPAPSFAPASAMKVDEEDHATAAFGGPDPFGKPEPADPDPAPIVIAAADAHTSVHSGKSTEPVASEQPKAVPSPNSTVEAAVAAVLNEVQTSASASDEKKPTPEAAMAAAAGAETSSDANLSSLVDSMLAELKPRLMAELAKKLEQKK